MIQLEPFAFTSRWLPEGSKPGDPFDTVATVVIMADLAMVFGLRGKMTRAYREELRAELAALGVTEVQVVRRGKRVSYHPDCTEPA